MKTKEAKEIRVEKSESNYEIGMKFLEVAENVYFAIGLLSNRIDETFNGILSKTNNFTVTTDEFICNSPEKLDKADLKFLSQNRKAVLCKIQLNALLQHGFYNSDDNVCKLIEKFTNAYCFTIGRTHRKNGQTFDDFLNEQKLNCLARMVKLDFDVCFNPKEKAENI